MPRSIPEEISAPPCPRWCQEHGPDDGWDYFIGGAAKHCRRSIPVDGGAEILLERYASLDDEGLVILDPEVRVQVDEALSLTDARTLSDTLRRVTEKVTEIMVAA